MHTHKQQTRTTHRAYTAHTVIIENDSKRFYNENINRNAFEVINFQIYTPNTQ